MNVVIEIPGTGARVRLSGSRGVYVLRTSFAPFPARAFIDAMDAHYRVERVSALESARPGGWLGEIEFGCGPDKAASLIDDLTELLATTCVASGPH